MEERMYRAQILLKPEQRRRLEEIARREGHSISAVTRQVIDAGLEALESEAEMWEKRARILSELRALREKQPSEYSGDLINEAREEQEDETERIWHGNT
jgi:predicted YcjX-like family ATPase